ncbi:hypothetical protein PUNSTDRAFT_62207 [Punctularia strigosozonata HHB-11173 SS5]|uniref:uncharacterized protein n=1 Tax=Punctularia strigosozonata (strain HHB-11173) TaxID=741275 RepID=UPI000441652A|nr:uncharacterized protein PUNSTDRAFT_62207 [Punctularia strigosozonata HHB-11173 SS5]EIN11670.1 hypothetical protein PUNSTDRAFT_62207 [Punctularia strigosozonata HHB-11173 SS5]
MRKIVKAVMRSYHLRIPKYDMPIRIRPWFIAITFGVMLALAFLGFTNFSHALPLNDKLLHFICLAIATGVFYFIWDVEEDARRIWIWRHAGLILTGIICFLFGGIMSEIVQSLLPYKQFQIGDVIANILGSAVGLYTSYYLEKYYRHRREISRLYQPLNADQLSDDDDDALEGTLPTHYQPYNPSPYPSHAGAPATPQSASKPNVPPKRQDRLGDVWDEREDIFDIGGDSDEEHEVRTPQIVVSPPK